MKVKVKSVDNAGPLNAFPYDNIGIKQHEYVVHLKYECKNAYD